MKAKTNTGYPLRFNSAKQKNAITKIADKNNRSLNQEILHLIDLKILSASTQGQTSK